MGVHRLLLRSVGFTAILLPTAILLNSASKNSATRLDRDWWNEDVRLSLRSSSETIIIVMALVDMDGACSTRMATAAVWTVAYASVFSQVAGATVLARIKVTGLVFIVDVLKTSITWRWSPASAVYAFDLAGDRTSK
jgi:hypothetical protein